MFDIVIKTFNRYHCLDKLLKSIEQYYPDKNIIIADDSVKFNEKFYQHNLNMEVLNVGVDVGLSYGRNEAMKLVKTEYALLLDDDFVFDERTDIHKLLTIAQHTDADVVGGSLDTNGKIDGYNQTMEITDRTLQYRWSDNPLEEHEGIQYQKCDIVYNFGLFRKKHKWDNKIKIKGEHADYFLRLKEKKGKVYYVPEVVIQHHPDRPQDYKHFRGRNDGFYYFFKKHKVDKIISATGQCAEKKHNQIKFYRV
jgi:glycosyltransferase involved in cell wall biosynthesis